MNPSDLLQTAIVPALARLKMDSPAARRFMLAIALQESALQHRRQVSSDGTEAGPASSFWQFEKNGGCKGVLTHRVTAPIMRKVCDDFNVEPTALGLWEAMRYQDIVAASAARLLVFTLPGALPENAADGWAQYLSAWRPGKPHIGTWAGNWSAAEQTVANF
jgi:hypothetical protein